MTLYWLGEQPGLKYPTLRKIFRGETKGVDFNTLDLICKYLNCKLSELIVRDEDIKATTTKRRALSNRVVTLPMSGKKIS